LLRTELTTISSLRRTNTKISNQVVNQQEQYKRTRRIFLEEGSGIPLRMKNYSSRTIHYDIK
ncbi:hypothetical protein GIB67_002454, partial [Kingdonia uniflora]